VYSERILSSQYLTPQCEARCEARQELCSMAAAGEVKPLVKICGTQDPDSAVIATKAGADFIGMIFVPKSK